MRMLGKYMLASGSMFGYVGSRSPSSVLTSIVYSWELAASIGQTRHSNTQTFGRDHSNPLSCVQEDHQPLSSDELLRSEFRSPRIP